MSVSTLVAPSATPAGRRRGIGRQLLDARRPWPVAQIGGNYQIGQFVIGAEADADWQNLRGATAAVSAPRP